MDRCLKYPDEEECLGHDCTDREGTPCDYDKYGIAGTEDLMDVEAEEDDDIYITVGT